MLKLYIVSTPIGNLKDITFRALETLRSVDAILCEDTRRAAKLKRKFSLPGRLISFHEHNERQRIPKIIERMKAGKTFALISDAGSPLISDPGFLLIQEMIKLDLPFTYIPGANAVIAALALSGLPAHAFGFYGFLPVASATRKTKLEQIATMTGQTFVLFESPERIVSLVREIGETLGNRRIAICREITKLHEEVIRGTVSEVLPLLSARALKGEFTVVIDAGEAAVETMNDETIRLRFQQLLNEGFNRKDALKKLVKESGRSRNNLYDLLMKE